MDVKEIRSDTKLSQDIIAPGTSESTQKAASTLSTGSVDTVTQDSSGAENFASQADSVQIDRRASATNDIRTKLNSVINVVNVAAEATLEIGKLVKSLNGIVSQVDSSDTTDKRKNVLQNEANQLVDAIKQQIQTSTPEGIKPLAGDPIRLEIEEKIGKTLEILLPDNSGDNLGISAVNFSRKEAIIDTRASVANAEKRLQDLEKSVEATKERVRQTAAQLDVAVQNSESAKSSIRDVDSALQLASDTKFTIGENPEAAIKSAGNLNQESLILLKY